ncbi:MAG: recombinase family protein, partial [Verrucomicrobia bacterium]|nr:recombinase family protein [Verrucomicrobiota bacterium]
MIYGYIRVSTDKQDLANQKFEITNFAAANGFAIDGWIDETISGAKDYKKRALFPLMKRLKPGDRIVCAELSRLGRELMMIMEILRYCLEHGIEIWTHKDG